MILNRIKIFLDLIKFEHTLFALPFAYMGAILGSVLQLDRLPMWSEIGWITLAMVGARSAAMALNRLIDRVIDKKNPRTAKRHIPAGLISTGTVTFFIMISFFLLFIAAFQLQPICIYLMPIAVFLLVFYSYTKRFTWLCHLILGLTIALAPLGGWIAITGQVNMISFIFYITVAIWTAGFDIIYACQDTDFDKNEGLYSIPSRFGNKVALRIARWLHFFTMIGFFVILFMAQLSWLYAIGAIISCLILWYEHRLVSPEDLSKLNTAFFTMNGILSCVVFMFTWLDVVILQ